MGVGDAGQPLVSAIIPCLDEADAIGRVVVAVLAQGVAEVIVVDGGSRDATIECARAAGARVVVEPRRGYGLAVQRGIAASRLDADVLLFIDGDGSDRAELISQLIAPIAEKRAVFTQGSRIKGEREPGSLSFPQVVAGHLAGLLIRLIYGVRFTDMSPFRAIRRDALERLGMQETGYGWNLEMLMRVAAAGMATQEIAVGQRRRIGGVSKVSGNAIASVKAVVAIVTTFVRLALSLRRDCARAAASTPAP
ncbi:MAG TPA: glycosyltransferase family 2 protein [Xanthobacteraceae bacterium]|nr:glycosyltransferase family 2 protein [Xanthobacteraceae bacterium]